MEFYDLKFIPSYIEVIKNRSLYIAEFFNAKLDISKNRETTRERGREEGSVPLGYGLIYRPVIRTRWDLQGLM